MRFFFIAVIASTVLTQAFAQTPAASTSISQPQYIQPSGTVPVSRQTLDMLVAFLSGANNAVGNQLMQSMIDGTKSARTTCPVPTPPQLPAPTLPPTPIPANGQP